MSKATSADFPKGCLFTAQKKLNAKHKLKITISKNDTIAKFYVIKLDKMSYKFKMYIDGMLEIRKDLKKNYDLMLSNVDFVLHVLLNC